MPDPNTPPVAKNPSFIADGKNLNTFPVSLLATDTTTAISSLSVTGVSGAQYGSAYTNNANLYYSPNGSSGIETLSYSVTDGEFTSTGTLRLSVNVDGNVDIAAGLTAIKELSAQVKLLADNSALWDAALLVTQTYSANWDSVDTARFNGYSGVVENNYQSWNTVYAAKNLLDTFYTLVTAYSAQWNTNTDSGSALYDIINPKSVEFNQFKNALDLYSSEWTNDIIDYNNINSNISDTRNKINSVSSTLISSSANWDSTELNQISSNYFSNWNSLSTLNENKLNSAISDTVSLTSSLATTTVSANSDEVYNTVNSLSSGWDINDLNTLSAQRFIKWTDGSQFLTSKKDAWSTTYNSSTALSAVFDQQIPKFDGYHTIVYSNKDNWNKSNSVSSISATALTGSSVTNYQFNDVDVHGNLLSLSSIIVTGDVKKYNTSYVTADSFEIYNQSTDEALDVNKIGGGGLIASFNNSTDRVMFVETNNTVGINSLTGTSTALTVGGSISATGYINPYLTSTINTYKAVSAGYGNIYSALTSSSATTISDLTAQKVNYDASVTYKNLSSTKIDTLLTTDNELYNRLYTKTVEQSANNKFVNDYVSLSSPYIDIDPKFVENKPKYDVLYTTYQLLTS